MVAKAALEAHENAKKSSDSSTSTTAESGYSLPITDARLERLAESAREAAEARFNSSEDFELSRRRLEYFPKFDFNELILGEVLGKGQFGVVTEIKGLNFDEATEECEDRLFIKSCCIRKGTEQAEQGDTCRYAIKMLGESHCKNEDEYLMGARDMAIEAHFLAAMEHPHILKLRGLSRDPTGTKHFFVVFDRLYATLKDRLVEWKWKSHVLKRGLNKIIQTKSIKEKKQVLLETRLRVMRDLSGAVMHMHQNHIINRDLKPDNIGFDIRGDVKLFDFGLSTQFDPMAPKPYNLTGMTGSAMFMAPEVHHSCPYDESCDIYSLGFIFWRVLSLEPLFPNLPPTMFKDLVVNRGARPTVNPKWSKTLQTLMCNMWDPVPTKRPDAKQVHLHLIRESALEKEKLQATGSVDIDDHIEKALLERKSTYAQRRFISDRGLHQTS